MSFTVEFYRTLPGCATRHNEKSGALRHRFRNSMDRQRAA
jgi:hypothetical protein